MGQFDKAGKPYVEHPRTVANMVIGDSAKVVAYLHDVIEDSDMEFSDLFGYGFDEDILKAIDLLTHNPEVPYMDYIAILAWDVLAREVKIADLKHNMDLSRLGKTTKKDVLRQYKYLKALALLMGVGLN